MRPQIRVNFAFYWPGFTPAVFQAQFPAVFAKYDLVISERPEVLFYGPFSPGSCETLSDGRFGFRMPRVAQQDLARVFNNPDCARVFITGENVEPDMEQCDFAITFSVLTDHPNHMRLPLWVYDLRRVGIAPTDLTKRQGTDWERIAAEKTAFCNFIYSHDVAFRNAAFATLRRHRDIDAVGRCMNNMRGFTVPNGAKGKLEFIRRYKFTLAVENAVWPGYTTEKLVEPMVAHSIPIYIGDPNAAVDFNPASFIDFSKFRSIAALIDYVRQIDNDRDLYLRTLAQPIFHDDVVPPYARDDVITAFFDRIFSAAVARR